MPGTIIIVTFAIVAIFSVFLWDEIWLQCAVYLASIILHASVAVFVHFQRVKSADPCNGVLDQ